MGHSFYRGFTCLKCGGPRSDYSSTYCEPCYRACKSTKDFSSYVRITDWERTPDGCMTRMVYNDGANGWELNRREPEHNLEWMRDETGCFDPTAW